MAVRNPLCSPLRSSITVEIFQKPSHVFVKVETEVRLQPRTLIKLKKLKDPCKSNASNQSASATNNVEEKWANAKQIGTLFQSHRIPSWSDGSNWNP